PSAASLQEREARAAHGGRSLARLRHGGDPPAGTGRGAAVTGYGDRHERTHMTERDLDFTIGTLGRGRFPSPMSSVRFTGDDERVLYHATLGDLQRWLDRAATPPAMEAAGPRRTLFFDPSTLACGIVTCGGLCPGLNDVIRSIVLSLYHHYGVQKVYGF